MKRIIIMFLFSLFGSVTVASVANAEQSEKSAQQFAEKYFVPIVLEHVNSDDFMHYNLSKSTNISYGKLYKVHRLSDEFVTTTKKLSGDLGIKESNEFVAAVYQDGKPVNVIGTVKDENGDFVLSSFGYGVDLAVALDRKKTNGGKIIYELPADAWYIFEEGKVTGFSKSAQEMLGTSLHLPEFREYIYDKYSSHKGIIEYGEETGVGGNYSTPYENKKENVKTNALLVTALLVIITIGFISYRIRRKNTDYVS